LFCSALTALLMLFGISLSLAAAQKEADEYDVKASCLRHLAYLTEFPAQAFTDDSAPLVIGVLGTNPFGRRLETTFNQVRISGRKVKIRYLGSRGNPAGCHIVFVSKAEAKRTSRVVASATGNHMLVVGEFANFCAAGGHLNYLIVGGKLRLEFNSDSAKRALLSIPARIQRAATEVKTR
jgi:hypothetical protein